MLYNHVLSVNFSLNWRTFWQNIASLKSVTFDIKSIIYTLCKFFISFNWWFFTEDQVIASLPKSPRLNIQISTVLWSGWYQFFMISQFPSRLLMTQDYNVKHVKQSAQLNTTVVHEVFTHKEKKLFQCKYERSVWKYQYWWNSFGKNNKIPKI